MNTLFLASNDQTSNIVWPITTQNTVLLSFLSLSHVPFFLWYISNESICSMWNSIQFLSVKYRTFLTTIWYWIAFVLIPISFSLGCQYLSFKYVVLLIYILQGVSFCFKVKTSVLKHPVEHSITILTKFAYQTYSHIFLA